ncbi:MAG: peptidylprolyl isomerase [Ignavibacteria bacterium]|jgi:parvulin-like peptidyl-prolyl isomerase/protein-S-isoprenylcysteine O-methyltransferase Ste14|nr:peptidylprolyl isomerase [Ignavibacteria bacterium]MDH7528539.1 peptidylprolyl isomerase [Ignavibacteria bacterium]
MQLVIEIIQIIFFFSIFAIIHSVLASLRIKNFIREKFGNLIAFYRIGYNFLSIISFGLFLYFAPKPHQIVFEIPYPFDLVVYILQILSLIGILWSAKNTDWKEFLGLSQIKRYFNGNYNDQLDENYKLKINGAYRISRHPIYLFSILFLALRPYMTVFYFVTLLLIILYFYIGSIFEEKKLEKIFGIDYINYKKEVSRIFPYKWLVKGFAMKKILAFLILAALLFTAENISAQSKDSILVDMGNKVITVDEFVTRFEFTPWPRRNIRYIDNELKLEFLKTLMAEKLLSIYGNEIKIDTSFDLNQAFNNLEKMIVRDALYRKEILGNIKIDQNELNNAIAKSQITLFVRYIFDPDSSEIYSIFFKLLNGSNFDSILSTRAESEDQKFPMPVTYGTLIEDFENVVYKTEPGDFTYPLKSTLGYYIFKVDSSKFEVGLGPKEFSDAARKAEKILKQRIEEKLYQEYFKKFFSKKRGEADGEVFWKFVDAAAKRFKWKFENQNPVRNNEYIIDVEDIRQIENQLGELKNQVLIKLENRNATVGEFLRSLLFKGFTVTDSSERYIAARLNKAIKNFLEDEYLAEEGFRQGLHLKPEVKKDIDMWRDFYYASWYTLTLKNNIQITDVEIENYIKERSIKSEEVIFVNVQEILVDSLEQVEVLLNKLRNGEDFGELARKYSKRKWAAEKNGELGFFPTSMYDEIGKTAERMNVGEIFAPVETKDGFSIIKLLDKKIERPDTVNVQDFSELKEKIRNELKQKKFDKERDKLVAELAQKYVKNINVDLLNSIKVTNLNMFVYRYMGFGGKMTAVPVIAPYISWYEEWKKINKTLP